MLKILKKIFPEKEKMVLKTHVVKADYKKPTMTCVWNDGSVTKYDGSSTVWHEQPLMKRCKTNQEVMLSDIYSYIEKWGNSYPDAHLKNQ